MSKRVVKRVVELTEMEVRDIEGPVLQTEAQGGGSVELPALTDIQVPIWQRCLDSRIKPRMLRAMRLVLAGYSFKEAGEIVEYRSIRDLFGHAQRLGVAGTSKRLMELQRANTHLALEQIGDDLLDPTLKITTKDKAIVAGIGHDKVARQEEREHNAHQVHTLAHLVQGIIDAMGGAELRLKVSKMPQEIDVTPTPILLDKND